MRARILFGVLAALISLPAAPPPPPPGVPPAYIFGAYGSRATGGDSIRVMRKAAGLVGVNLKLYYAGGHTCQLSKDGRWRDDHVAVVADGLDPNRSCRLNLFFENSSVRLKDEGLQCAPVYCGTRGKLDSVSLPKVP